MNNLYENNMKTLSKALEYCETAFSHKEIIEVLSSDDDIKKQLCILNLDELNNQLEADILVNNLTKHSGPVRETASYKILEFISSPDYNTFFQSEDIMNTFVSAVADINPSVSRNAVQILKYVQNTDYIYKSLIETINNILENIDNETKNRSYVQNKKNFSLYWNLEAIISIADKITAGNELVEILKETAKSADYTIREKTAKTARKFSCKNPAFLFVTDLLKNDVNIYVKKYI